MSKTLKESNRSQAAHIPIKLKAVGYGMRPSGKNPKPINLTKKQVEEFARMEHERWVNVYESAGWIYGSKRDDSRKIHNCFLPWDKLTDDIKDWDREAVKEIPALLDAAGFEVCKL